VAGLTRGRQVSSKRPKRTWREWGSKESKRIFGRDHSRIRISLEIRAIVERISTTVGKCVLLLMSRKRRNRKNKKQKEKKMNEVRINLMVVEMGAVNDTSDMKFFAEPAEGMDHEEARRQWGLSPEDKVAVIYPLTLKDEGEDRPYATTYEVLMALNNLSDEPRVQDLLTRIFALGFEAGTKYKEQVVRSTLGLS